MKLNRRGVGRPSLGGLVSTRPGALALAVICALAACVILVYALGQYRRNVTTATKQATVLVSTGLIQKGTPGELIASRQLYKAMPIVADQASPGVLTDAALLTGLVAAHDILPGQQLRTTDFTAKGGYETRLAPGERATSIPLDASHGLSSVLQAGDHVDVYVVPKGNVGTYQGIPPGGSGAATITGQNLPALTTRYLLMTNVTVMAVNVNGAASGSGGGSTGAIADVVLKTNTTEVGALDMASDNTNFAIWLVLRGVNAITPAIESTVPNETPNPVTGINQ